MTFLTALAVGILFGCGAYAMAHRDAFKLTGGTLLIGNSAILFLMAPALRGGAAAFCPRRPPISWPIRWCRPSRSPRW